MTDEMYEDLLERNKLQISELNTLTEEQDCHIVELEKENAELLGIIQGKDKVIQELEKENAKLKEQVENRNCSNCRRSKTGCPNDGSCHNFSLWQPFINPELTKAMNEAKGIIKDLLQILPKENIEGIYEVTEEAEQFLKELEK